MITDFLLVCLLKSARFTKINMIKYRSNLKKIYDREKRRRRELTQMNEFHCLWPPLTWISSVQFIQQFNWTSYWRRKLIKNSFLFIHFIKGFQFVSFCLFENHSAFHFCHFPPMPGPLPMSADHRPFGNGMQLWMQSHYKTLKFAKTQRICMHFWSKIGYSKFQDPTRNRKYVFEIEKNIENFIQSNISISIRIPNT